METNRDKAQRLHVIVEGRVQGVGFRYFTLYQARRLMLTGWVRNLPGGKVEVEAEGAQENLNLFLEELKQGPAGSHILQIRSDWTAATGEDVTFRVRM